MGRGGARRVEEPRIKVLPELSERNSNSWARTGRTSLYHWNKSCIIEVVRHAIFSCLLQESMLSIFLWRMPLSLSQLPVITHCETSMSQG